MSTSPGQRLIEKFEQVIIALLQLLLVIVVSAATIQLFVLLFERIPGMFGRVENTDELHTLMQRGFAGVLVVVLGLELIETLKVYFRDHKVRVEVIMIVSLIAVGRHIIQVNYEEMSGVQLLGLAALILSLAGGYFLISRAHQGEGESDRSRDS